MKLLKPEEIDYKKMIVNEDGLTVEYDDVKLNPNPNGKVHDHSERFIYKLLDGWSLSPRKVCKLKNNKPLLENHHPPLLHYSVIDKIFNENKYRPLPEIREHKVMHENGEITSHLSLNEHYINKRTIKKGLKLS